jgi:hypothetical protein
LLTPESGLAEFFFNASATGLSIEEVQQLQQQITKFP